MRTYRLDDCHVVIELHDVVDIGNDEATKDRLRRVMEESAVRRAIIDIRTPVVTAACLDMLLALRRALLPSGFLITVVARHRLARRVFRIAALSRTFHVTATVPRARALTRACHTAGRHPVPQPPAAPCPTDPESGRHPSSAKPATA
ncbi:hypothetical protein OG985_42335 [Streptomyces sp. NBC_00289]|uniref:hypothetical protein n=1 Tax=Streptomyces sp. NBC_00289 TaxID=2975703 RepID=UPI003243851F